VVTTGESETEENIQDINRFSVGDVTLVLKSTSQFMKQFLLITNQRAINKNEAGLTVTKMMSVTVVHGTVLATETILVIDAIAARHTSLAVLLARGCSLHFSFAQRAKQF